MPAYPREPVTVAVLIWTVKRAERDRGADRRLDRLNLTVVKRECHLLERFAIARIEPRHPGEGIAPRLEREQLRVTEAEKIHFITSHSKIGELGLYAPGIPCCLQRQSVISQPKGPRLNVR